jgi:hypothetical protein
MNLNIWGVLCMCEYPDDGHGDYSENIYGEYHSEQEAEAALQEAYTDALQRREDDPTDPYSYTFKVLDPRELYDWQTAG